MGLAVVGTAVWAVWFLLHNGRLPQPFLWIVSDTFMDWHNPAFWSHNPGTYDTWQSVYPPLSFAFLKVFSNGACYVNDPLQGRDCDWWGQVSLLGFYALNGWLLFLHFRMVDPRTALVRAIVLTVGMPMLFGLERGNLIIPCFTAFILGHSHILKSARLRWLAHAFAINFKPYLVLQLLPLIARRRWRWFEGAGLATLMLYLVTLAIINGGTPMQVVDNIRVLAVMTSGSSWADLYYATSYAPMLRFINSDFPVMYFVGSRPVDWLNVGLPLLMHVSQAAVVAAFAAAWLRPGVVRERWLAGGISAMILSTSQPSGYAEIFLLFFVFMEPWRGPTRIIMLISAYALSLVGDMVIYNIPQGPADSWLGHQYVVPEAGIAIGQFVRPALILLIQFCYAFLALRAAWRAPRPALRSRNATGLPQGA